MPKKYLQTYSSFRDSLSLINQESFDLNIDLNKIQIIKNTPTTASLDPMQSYFLKGKAGRGKTAIALNLAKRWLEMFKIHQNNKYEAYLDNRDNGYTYEFIDSMYLGKVNFVPINQLIECINDAFGISQCKFAQQVYARWCEIPFLIIDDLGKEKLSDFRANRVNHLIDERQGQRLQTVITTNYTAESLIEAGYSDAMIDRILSLTSRDNVFEVYSANTRRVDHPTARTTFDTPKAQFGQLAGVREDIMKVIYN